MKNTSEVYAQLKKDAPIEPWLGAITSTLFARISPAIRYGSTTLDAPYVLGYEHLLRTMRNAQYLFCNAIEAEDKNGVLDISKYNGGLSSITNSNPTSNLLVLRHVDTFNKVGSNLVSARSCNLDLTCGDKELIPLAVAMAKGDCSDADYYSTYQPESSSQFEFFFNPLNHLPMHCLVTHPHQIDYGEYNQLDDTSKASIRNMVEPYWKRVIRLNEKIAKFSIEV